MLEAFPKMDNVSMLPIHLPSPHFYHRPFIPSFLPSPSWCKSHQWAAHSREIPSFGGRRLGGEHRQLDLNKDHLPYGFVPKLGALMDSVWTFSACVCVCVCISGEERGETSHDKTACMY